MDKCLPFYNPLRENKKFIWDEKCEKALWQLEEYLTTLSVLAELDEEDTLYLYIAVSSLVVSSILIKEDQGE